MIIGTVGTKLFESLTNFESGRNNDTGEIRVFDATRRISG